MDISWFHPAGRAIKTRLADSIRAKSWSRQYETACDRWRIIAGQRPVHGARVLAFRADQRAACTWMQPIEMAFVSSSRWEPMIQRSASNERGRMGPYIVYSVMHILVQWEYSMGRRTRSG